MKRCILILLLLAGCSSPSTTMRLQTLSLVDRHGFSETVTTKERLQLFAKTDFQQPQPYEKVVQIFERREGSLRSIVSSYYENGQIRQYLEALNSVACGIYRQWHPNGVLHMDGRVIGGDADLSEQCQKTWVFDKECRVYSESGTLLAHISYCRGVLQGLCQEFLASGSLKRECFYEKGLLEGKSFLYDDEGRIKEVCEYHRGEKEGVCETYEADFLLAREVWQKGKLVSGEYQTSAGFTARIEQGCGQRALFDKGCLCELQQWQEGRLCGKICLFDSQERLASCFEIKDGLKHGQEVHYFTGSKQQKVLLNWHQGSLQGPVYTWYSNGSLESVKEYSANKKNGLCTVYFQSGSTMMIEEYRQDRLVHGQYYRQRETTPLCRVESGNGTAALFDGSGLFLRYVEYRDGRPCIDERL